MLPASLTRASERIDGRLCHRYAWRGGSVAVCDSVRNMLLVIELFADGELSPSEKLDMLLPMLFPASELESTVEEAGDGLGDLLQSVLWDACGIDVTGERDCGGAKAFDWDEDAARIQASVMQAYGQTWDEFSEGHSFAEGCALLGELVEGDGGTPFAQALRYRLGRPPRRTKWNGEQVRAWHELADHYALGGGRAPESAMARENDAAASLFASLVKAGEA